MPDTNAALIPAGEVGLSVPFGMLAELTHRCPLACPYCSNPLELEARAGELTTAEWADVFAQAGRLGVLQLHLSGGEPMSRRDIVEIVASARDAGLYTNLITSAIGLDRPRLERLRDAGLDHVQVSIQDSEPESADRIAGYPGAHRRKLEVARMVVKAGLALTINAVVHRANIERVEQLVALAASLGAGRIEVAHTQYYGWALRNRDALMPTREQAMRAVGLLEGLRAQYAGRLVIDAVLPDYYSRRPKPCMGGWAKRSLNVTPSGRVLPCHAAETIPGLEFWSVRDHGLAEIWARSPAFQAFRGEAWMQEPCRSCDRRSIDFGGCRCQAMALAGDPAATDPACELSPLHGMMQDLAAQAGVSPPNYIYRGRTKLPAA
jgi:pyrroloquinoline quinone biosynthesis protein E